jgi:hypothetical protein
MLVKFEAESQADPDEELDETPVSLRHRALPLIELLTAAVESKSHVSWEETIKLFPLNDTLLKVF